MTKQEILLQEKKTEYDDYVKANGYTKEIINAYAKLIEAAFNSYDIDAKVAKKVSAEVKSDFDKAIYEMSEGGDFIWVESRLAATNGQHPLIDGYYDVLKAEAPYLFDSYLLYLEKDRKESDRFYSPKRDVLIKHGLIQAMQDLEDDKLDLLSISMPPGTQKTTLEKFFCSWIIGRHPDDYSLFFSHSGDITRMFYDGILDITTNEAEYKWHEIFNVNLQGTNAKAEQINFGKYKPFSSIQCTSVGSKNAGKVRCNRYLYCDDLIGGIEEALNKNILDKLWNIYSVDARQRKLNEQVKEIHIATRWSVHDVIGRLKSVYENSERARFIAIPDIDPETGESNFNYKFNGMSTQFFNDQELLMDDISYRCLYKNEPIEREGLLYHEDDLRRYLSLPLQEPDAIIGVCDTKTSGSDYMVLPVFYQYGDDYYLVDTICDNSSDFGVQQGRLVNIILQHNMQQCEFESNAGGSRLAKDVSDKIVQQGGRCNITTKPTETNKETRIIVNSDWIKKHCLFKDKEQYVRKSDYGEFMYWLLSYSVTGKNPHDDVPDCLANFALYCTKESRVARVEAVRNPFAGGMWY